MVARPSPPPEGVVRRFTRGKEHPRGVAWFGARSFWGHLRHFIAAAIATENVDSRDWMTPDDPGALAGRISAALGGSAAAATLVEGLGRDLYIDFVADTGDDAAVSRAVARLVFAPYELPDPDRPAGGVLLAPRGDILLFGGDTAYPVATAQEIANRVITPWNQVLDAAPGDGRRRVLLGVAGNHDWYDGLDGFRRMFRRRDPRDEAVPPPAVVPEIMLEHYVRWTREFFRGGLVEKPRALALSGYTPLQEATYFALPLAPGIDLLTVDRQLTVTDARQRRYLRDYRASRPDAAPFILLPDPVYPFGDPSRSGEEMIDALGHDLAGREAFVLSGDIHHYERLEHGKLLEVIAGGGGAFLHPARIAPGGLPSTVVWPGKAQCRSLLRQVPWKVACGRSGFLPHLVLLALFLPALKLGAPSSWRAALAVGAVTLILGSIYALIGGVTRKASVIPWALGAALLTAIIPVAGARAWHDALALFGQTSSPRMALVAVLALAVFAGAFVFGAYLSVLTWLGFENTQAFTALDHPGFKHFVRLRVRADGTGIDGWCVGASDPLGAGAGATPVLVDSFTWRPSRR